MNILIKIKFAFLSALFFTVFSYKTVNGNVVNYNSYDSDLKNAHNKLVSAIGDLHKSSFGQLTSFRATIEDNSVGPAQNSPISTKEKFISAIRKGEITLQEMLEKTTLGADQKILFVNIFNTFVEGYQQVYGPFFEQCTDIDAFLKSEYDTSSRKETEVTLNDKNAVYCFQQNATYCSGGVVFLDKETPLQTLVDILNQAENIRVNVEFANAKNSFLRLQEGKFRWALFQLLDEISQPDFNQAPQADVDEPFTITFTAGAEVSIEMPNFVQLSLLRDYTRGIKNAEREELVSFSLYQTAIGGYRPFEYYPHNPFTHAHTHAQIDWSNAFSNERSKKTSILLHQIMRGAEPVIQLVPHILHVPMFSAKDLRLFEELDRKIEQIAQHTLQYHQTRTGAGWSATENIMLYGNNEKISSSNRRDLKKLWIDQLRRRDVRVPLINESLIFQECNGFGHIEREYKGIYAAIMVLEQWIRDLQKDPRMVALKLEDQLIQKFSISIRWLATFWGSHLTIDSPYKNLLQTLWYTKTLCDQYCDQWQDFLKANHKAEENFFSALMQSITHISEQNEKCAQGASGRDFLITYSMIKFLQENHLNFPVKQ